MTGEEFKGMIAEVEKYYSKQIPSEAKKRIFQTIHTFPAKALFKAVDRMMMEYTYMPAPAKIVETVEKEGKSINMEEAQRREEEAKAEKEACRQGAARAFKDQSGIAKAALMVARAIYGGRIQRGEALNKFRELHKMYPHAGFDVEGSKLQRYYESQQMDLSQDCGGKIVLEET